MGEGAQANEPAFFGFCKILDALDQTLPLFVGGADQMKVHDVLVLAHGHERKPARLPFKLSSLGVLNAPHNHKQVIGLD